VPSFGQNVLVTSFIMVDKTVRNYTGFHENHKNGPVRFHQLVGFQSNKTQF
jgi:hypothetical protein